MNNSSHSVHLFRSVAFKAVYTLGLWVVLPMLVLLITLNTYYVDWLAEEQLINSGRNIIQTLRDNARDSINKGQRSTFQQVLNGSAIGMQLEHAALYNNAGLMTYHSGEPSVGLPFEIEGGVLKNPNTELYEASDGEYEREDWSIRDVHERKSAIEHIDEYKSKGEECSDCHPMVDKDITFDDQGIGYKLTETGIDYYERIGVEPECIHCHTHWKDGDTAGYLQVVIDESKLGHRDDSFVILATVVIAILIPVLLGTFLIIRFIVLKPIYSINQSLHEIAIGDGDLTKRLAEVGKDEITALAINFNKFTSKIESVVNQVMTVTTKLGVTTQGLESVAERTGKSVEVQREESGRVMASVEEMSASAEEATQNASLASESAMQTSEVARQGQAVVGQTVSSISELASDVVKTSEVIKKLEEESNNIGAILDTIRAIAEQTNLLALNAAIEAARAGDKGRGFAVVADEVRTLASNTQQATTHIQDMIEALQQNAAEAVSDMNESRMRADGSVEYAEKAGVSLDDITQKINAINEMTSGIQQTFEQHNLSSNQITQAIGSIDERIGNTVDGVKETENAVLQLSNQIAELDGVVSQFKTSNSSNDTD